MEYIQERKLRAPDLATIASSLRLLVYSTSTTNNKFRITAELLNEGSESIRIQFLNIGSLGRLNLLDSYKHKPELNLAPNERFTFPGWCNVAMTDTMKDGKIIRRCYSLHDCMASIRQVSKHGLPKDVYRESAPH